VLSVGGTSLQVGTGGSYLGESGWYGSGGGFSSFEPERAVQMGVQQTGVRTTPDVAYNADPNTGVYVYDSTNGGWFQVGGTSAGAPQWAALVAIADQGRALAGQASLYSSSQTMTALYDMARSSAATYFHDVTGGSNGYLATAGYDLVTGLGTPRANAVVQALVHVTGLGPSLTFTSTSASAKSAATTQSAAHNSESTPTSTPVDMSASNTTSDQAQLAGGLSAARTPAPAAIQPGSAQVPASTSAADMTRFALATLTQTGDHTTAANPSRVSPLSSNFPQVGDTAFNPDEEEVPAFSTPILNPESEPAVPNRSTPAEGGTRSETGDTAQLSARDACFADGSWLGASLQQAVNAAPATESLAAPLGLLILGAAWGSAGAPEREKEHQVAVNLNTPPRRG
jgi:hypothetical protein